MLATPKKNTPNWYKCDISFSIELLQSYIDGIENQIASSIKAYRDKTGTDYIEEHFDESNSFITEIQNGLDDQSWDLKEVFEVHFPSLQRNSALITLFSFLEKELDSLCILFQKEKKLKLKLKDINGKGIDRATTYLMKVASLNFTKSTEWNEVKSIQKIRNLIVHNGGSLENPDGSTKKHEVEYIESCKFLSGEKEVLIQNGYLEYVLSSIDSYFRTIERSITEVKNA